MSGKKRLRRKRTHDWQQIQQYTLWPEQHVLYGDKDTEIPLPPDVNDVSVGL